MVLNKHPISNMTAEEFFTMDYVDDLNNDLVITIACIFHKTSYLKQFY